MGNFDDANVDKNLLSQIFADDDDDDILNGLLEETSGEEIKKESEKQAEKKNEEDKSADKEKDKDTTSSAIHRGVEHLQAEPSHSESGAPSSNSSHSQRVAADTLFD